MADSRSLNDRFARGAAPGGKGFVSAKDPFAPKAAASAGDAFAPAPKSTPFVKAPKPAKVLKAAPAAKPLDAFAPKAKPAKAPAMTAAPADPTMKAAVQSKPAAQKFASFGSAFVRPTSQAKVTPPAPRRSGMTAPAIAPAEKIVRPKTPALRPVTASSTRQKSLMVKPTPIAAEAPKSPMVMLAASGLAAAKPQPSSGFYNPFAPKRPAVPPVDATSPRRDMFDPDPEFADAPERTPDAMPASPKPKRGLHVITAPERSVSAIAEAAKSRPAARASSLVLVSGAGALTAAAEAPVTEKPPEPEAPAAEKPAAAPPPPKAGADTGKEFWGGGGSGGGGSGKGPTGGAAAKPLFRRGFNQDDIFGVVFGIAVLAFLLLWFMRGKGEEVPTDDLLATTQSVNTQSFAALPAPAPAPKVDPFGDAPVDLKPTGPIPETPTADLEVVPVAPPAATPAPAPVAPATVAPPKAVANPEAAIPIAERKMHAWFCTASNRLTKPSRTELTGEMAKFEDIFKGKELIVRGYADTRGSAELNADLGSRRAQTVADYLTAKGLSVVDVQGVGELAGLDDNQNCPNQRRVDVWVKGGPAEMPSRACAPEPEAESLICG